jgi:hypothetical protein
MVRLWGPAIRIIPGKHDIIISGSSDAERSESSALILALLGKKGRAPAAWYVGLLYNVYSGLFLVFYPLP